MPDAECPAVNPCHLSCTELGNPVPVKWGARAVRAHPAFNPAMLCLTACADKHFASHIPGSFHSIKACPDIRFLHAHVIASRSDRSTPSEMKECIRMPHLFRQCAHLGQVKA
jgi:hypothetical protein